MLGEELAELVHDREDRFAAVHDRTAADLDDLQPGQQRDRPHTGDRRVSWSSRRVWRARGEATCLMSVVSDIG